MDVLSKPNVPSGLLKTNGVDYLLPPTEQAGPLVNDGAGNLAWGASPYQNVIANGDMRGARRWTSVANPADWILDNWQWIVTGAGAGVITGSQATDAPTVGPNAIHTPYSLRILVTTANTSIATGVAHLLYQSVRGYDLQALTNGFAVSFWVRSAVTGVHCISFANVGTPPSNRAYIAEYTVNVANTWEYKTLVVPAPPTAGTWDYTSGVGLYVSFALSCGATFQTTPGAWQTGDFFGTANQVNVMHDVNNIFAVTLVNTIPGPTPQPFIPHLVGLHMGFGDPRVAADIVVGGTSVAGASLVSSPSDHTHAMPGVATPAIALGSSAAAGSAATVIRSDSTIAAFDTTAPTTQAFGDSAAVGTAAFATRRDHKHAMPSDPNAVTTAVHGLPASVAVLGNRNASGEFIQRGNFAAAGTNGGAVSFGVVNQAAVTFPVAFSATPQIICHTHNVSNCFFGSVVSPSGSGFTPQTWGVATGVPNGTVYWLAIGT